MWVLVLWGKGYVIPVDPMRATSERKPIGAKWCGVEQGVDDWMPRADDVHGWGSQAGHAGWWETSPWCAI